MPEQSIYYNIIDDLNSRRIVLLNSFTKYHKNRTTFCSQQENKS